MDSPRIIAAASGKQDAGFRFFGLCLWLIAVIPGLIDINAGYHRALPTFANAPSACYFANRLWPNRRWSIIGVPAAIAALVAFFI
jgi:hypothetical protein